MSKTKEIVYELPINLTLKPKKRFRVCLRCQKPMLKKNRCENCKTKFHDGILLGWLKRFLGISPK